MAKQGGSGPANATPQRLAAAARAGDREAFAALAEPHRAELRVHCYRMLGSFDESEDLVQETLLRAWRNRATFEGRAPFRAWLYKIATNACLDFLDRQPRQPLPVGAATSGEPPPPAAVPWLQPYPDVLLDRAVPADATPEAVAVARETIGLAFLVAGQHLPPRQRAILILRDVLGWTARQTASALSTSVASVNSALQRARPMLRQHLPERRTEWRLAAAPTERERVVLQRFLRAVERADDAAIAEVLAADARCGHQARASGHAGAGPTWYEGRDTLVAAWAPALHGRDAVEFRHVPVRVNRQVAAISYIRPRGSSGEFAAFGLSVYQVDAGRIVEITNFLPAESVLVATRHDREGFDRL